MPGDFTFDQLPNNTASSWWRDPGLRKLVFLMATLTCSAVGSGVDGSLINGIQILPACQLSMVVGHRADIQTRKISATFPMLTAVLSQLPFRSVRCPLYPSRRTRWIDMDESFLSCSAVYP